MWESVERLVESGKGWFVLIIIALMVFAIRQGYMKVKTEKILIGRDSSERIQLIMMKQSDYAHYACKAFEKSIPRFEGYDAKLGRLISEIAYDEVVKWIMVNHINDSDYYVANKQEAIWNIIVSETVDERMRSKKFHDIVNENVLQIIEQLISIREENMK